MGHESQRAIVRFVPQIHGVYPVYTHANCVCNEEIAATNRVMGRVPRPSKNGLRILRRELKAMANKMQGIVPYTMDEFVDCYTGRRKGRYETACMHLRNDPDIGPDKARVKAFVKAEKFNPFDKKNPDPRMIQGRSYEYNVQLGCYLKPMEHQLYRMKGPTGLRAIAKGLNMRKRGALLVKKMSQFNRPVVVSIDGSRWDKHIDVQVLKAEHGFYNRVHRDPHLQRLLSWQITNKCQTAGGLTYKVVGRRMSGDMNTALGNCVLMVAMCRAAMAEMGITRWDLMDDGDDCLLIFEEDDLDLVRWRAPQVFLEFGQEIKIENISRTVEGVEFCQTHPVLHPNGWRMTRNWKKVLSTGTSGYRHWNDPNLVRPMFTAVGQCELSLSAGTPILQEWALACIRNGRGKAPPKIFREEYQWGAYLKAELGLGFGDALKVEWDTRLSFEAAWGISPLDQMLIEEQLRQWVVDDVATGPIRPAELDHRWELDVDVEDPIGWIL